MEKSWVRFGYVDRSLPLRHKRRVHDFLIKMIHQECGLSCRIQYVFCGDEYLRSINLSFLEHDYFTDVITFDLSENPEKVIEGEIYISVDRVRDNANVMGLGFDCEMLRVIFHGALHLVGYDDKSVSDEVIMRKKEDEWLSLYNFL